MTRINISGPSHQVEVQHDGGDLSYIIERAQKLFDDTKPVDRGTGPAVGFSMERQQQGNGWKRFDTDTLPVRMERP